MELTDKDITRFQALYKKRFGTVIDRKSARQQLALLVQQVETITRPINGGLDIEMNMENTHEKPRARQNY